MAYATKYYDYQVAIIFAILLAGLLLLALVVGAIYFICVVNMRGKKGGISRMPSGRSTVARTQQMYWPSGYQPEEYIATPQQQQQYGAEPSYAQQQPPQPAAQQQFEYTISRPAEVRVRELQPDYFQQEGPVTYTSVYLPGQQPAQDPTIGTSYHMSSV